MKHISLKLLNDLEPLIDQFAERGDIPRSWIDRALERCLEVEEYIKANPCAYPNQDERSKAALKATYFTFVIVLRISQNYTPISRQS